jgi:hypothetical protein
MHSTHLMLADLQGSRDAETISGGGGAEDDAERMTRDAMKGEKSLGGSWVPAGSGPASGGLP